MRKISALLLTLLFSLSAGATGPVYLYDGAGNPISSTLGALNVNASITGTNPTIGAAVPATANYVAGNKGGLLTGLLFGQQLMANSLACVLPSDQSAIPVSENGVWNITNISGTISLPTGASTAAKQPALGTAGAASADVITVQGVASMTALKVDGSGVTQPVSGTVAATQSGAWTTGRTWSLLNTTDSVNAVQSGTWNIGSITTLPSLVAGAAIIGKVGIDQTTPGTTNGVQVNAALPAGANLMGKVGIDQTTPGTTNAVSVAQVGANTVLTGNGVTGTGSQRVTIASDNTAFLVKAQQYDGAGNAINKGQTTMSGSMPVTIASDQVAPKTYANSAGTFVLNASLTTVVSETCPAGGVGFILEASSSNTANIRWALGATATTSSGMRLEPGRDSVFVPVCATISIVSESGTNEYELTWIKQ